MNNLVGLDLGNRYGKLKSEMGTDEIIVSWRKIDATDYETLELVDGMERVKYKDNYYVVGVTGTVGINSANKGIEEEREMANMVKLIMLARDMRKREVKEMNYKAVTGTPYDDYDKYYDDYVALMKSGDEFETIELNGEEYKIKVMNTSITKQGACVILTLPNRKEKNYIIFDFGGGTLDISYFENGVRIKGHTIDFSLNQLYIELAKELNKYIDITRPSLNNAGFMKDMEDLKLKGTYKGISTIEINGSVRALKDYVSEWFQVKVDDIIAQSINELNFNKSEINNMTAVHVGGGAKLLKEELLKNVKFNNKMLGENTEYRNVIAYYEIAKLTKDWK